MQPFRVGTIVRSAGLLRRGKIAAVSALVLVALPATAVEVDYTGEVLSDYRFRGISISDRKPILDASVEASSGSWFAGIEAISAARVRSPSRAPRRNAEIDLSAGWSRSLGLLKPSVGAIAYLHPGGGEAVNGEVFASLAGALGPATLTIGANYAPDQNEARGGNFYIFTHSAVSVPGTPLTVRARIGREAGAFAGGQPKLDWLGGVEARVFRVVTVGLDYVGNDLPPASSGRTRRNRDDGVVTRAGVHF